MTGDSKDRSCEARVAQSLYRWFKAREGCTVVGFHPPNGKSYDVDLIRIPRKGRHGTLSERNHVDLVVTERNVLLLIELKCCLSECEDDIEKLREIRDTYSVTELADLISRRVTSQSKLAGVDTLGICLGFEKADLDSYPADFVTLCTTNSTPRISIGSEVPAAVRTVLS